MDCSYRTKIITKLERKDRWYIITICIKQHSLINQTPKISTDFIQCLGERTKISIFSLLIFYTNRLLINKRSTLTSQSNVCYHRQSNKVSAFQPPTQCIFSDTFCTYPFKQQGIIHSSRDHICNFTWVNQSGDFS